MHIKNNLLTPPVQVRCDLIQQEPGVASTDVRPAGDVRITRSGDRLDLDASASTDPDGTVTRVDWYVERQSGEELAEGARSTIPLPADEPVSVTAVVTDDRGMTDFVSDVVPATGDDSATGGGRRTMVLRGGPQMPVTSIDTGALAQDGGTGSTVADAQQVDTDADGDQDLVITLDADGDETAVHHRTDHRRLEHVRLRADRLSPAGPAGPGRLRATRSGPSRGRRGSGTPPRARPVRTARIPRPRRALRRTESPAREGPPHRRDLAMVPWDRPGDERRTRARGQGRARPERAPSPDRQHHGSGSHGRTRAPRRSAGRTGLGMVVRSVDRPAQGSTVTLIASPAATMSRASRAFSSGTCRVMRSATGT